MTFASLAHCALRSSSAYLTKKPTPLTRCFSAVANTQFLVINSVGVDRTGIVSDVSKVVTDCGGNVGESRAVKLGNHFSMMMLVSVPKPDKDSLLSALLSMKDMNITAMETSDPKEIEVTPQIGYAGHFSLNGADNPGIVHRITSVLAKYDLSIQRLETSQEEAPFGGTTLFLMEGIATAHRPLPKTFDIGAIKSELSDLGDSLNCDISLEDMDDSAYEARAV